MRNRVTDACARALACCGFTRRRHGILLQPEHGWLDLRLSDEGTSVVAEPVVGVRHRPVEKILVATAGWDEPVACVTLPVGGRWVFPAGGDLVAVADELAEVVVVRGQPFIDRWADWAALRREIGGLLPEATRFFLLPAVALADGDRDRARALIAEESARLVARDDKYAVAYRDYARRFTRLARGDV
ncbi:hypothetical protein [Actinoplanes regularis]|uniref:Uncharacterized protein n=1 Tax=Actinoplanes regularis TaxID=52697 RepID=A0A239BQ06_9ACTN|nr:hypothetical protein [Actinoplanes regularis]GIE88355.1 hypothetical protein Are01nite_48350 [Actinoplanes regularis]SNS09956.1 hypothetical protein SAMN06264365_11061 [Actinoplanes regularis]